MALIADDKTSFLESASQYVCDNLLNIYCSNSHKSHFKKKSNTNMFFLKFYNSFIIIHIGSSGFSMEMAGKI